MVLHYGKTHRLHRVPAEQTMSPNVSLISGPLHLIPCIIVTLRNATQSLRFEWHLLFNTLTGAVQTHASDNALQTIKAKQEMTKTQIYIYFSPCLSKTLS